MSFVGVVWWGKVAKARRNSTAMDCWSECTMMTPMQKGVLKGCLCDGLPAGQGQRKNTMSPCKRWGASMCLHFLPFKGPEFNQSWGNHQGDLIRPYTGEEAHFLAFLSEKYRSTDSLPSLHFLRIRTHWDMVRIWWSSTGNTGKGLLWNVLDFVLGSHSDWLKGMVFQVGCNITIGFTSLDELVGKKVV